RAAAGQGKGAQAKQGTLKSRRGTWRRVAAWTPFAAKVLLVVCLGLVLFKGYRAAAASEFFDLKSVDVAGTARASDDQIRQIVRRAAAGGVWQADLDAIASEIERQPWVRSATVARVLPSGLRVRVAERVPRVVVRTNAGRFVWVDEEAVMVGSLAPDHQQPAFFLRGWDESGTDAARTGNRERVSKFLSLAREWEAAGLSSRVSEVNLDDMRDVRAQLAGDDSEIEVRLGRQEWTKRLVQAVGALEEHRAAPRGGQITYIDMTQNRRAVLGFKSGTSVQPAAAAVEPAAADARTVNAVAPPADSHPREPAVRTPAAKKSSEKPARATEKKPEKKAEKKAQKKSPAPNDRTATGDERPRRVGGEGEQN
ncbi:MAG TPA: FtsQ-type POTRA domain-containing protein, partial [Pyrinomonadaceae bacterium]|nr:FtsQ-type POTRA domain-containing protein [Pyrinomonadaceae bacterium]